MGATLWPKEPIPANPVESLIESFWIPELRAVERWRVRRCGKARGVRFSHFWDSTHLDFAADAAGAGVSIRRDYALDVGTFKTMLVRLRTGEGARVSLFATIDGRRRTIFENVPGSNEEQEIGGPLGIAAEAPGELERVELRVTSERPGPQPVILRWVLLGRPGERWRPPARLFDGMIREKGRGRFAPGLGLIFGEKELAQMRQIYTSPAFARIWKWDQQLAARQYKVDPARLIRQYALYAVSRYGRPWDLDVDLDNGDLLLALVGLLTGNADYLRQAARHAIVFARIEHWSEGFTDRTPGLYWYHSGFAPNVATIKASLLLDWTWHWLTPEGRQLIRRAIRKKGLPYIELAKNAMANQGIRFNKGRILGHMAVTDDWSSPRVQGKVRSSLRIINGKMDAVVRPDGTFSEGLGYGTGTTASTFLSYVAASRCLGRPVKELASPRILPALRYILDAEGATAPVLAAFAAGPLEDAEFARHCKPTCLLQGYLNGNPRSVAGNSCELVYYGLPNLWAPELHKKTRHPLLGPFSVCRDGGWVFMGSRDPAAPRVTFESGLWDGLGHSWLHKNAVTMTGWGRTLLLPRGHLLYDDARSDYTMSTKLNNTFAPGGRDQDATGTPGRGAKLLVAEDLGPVAAAASDNATAWRTGVKKALRRVVFIRPYVLIVEDMGEFVKAETGVQSWNCLSPWRIVDRQTVQTTLGSVTVRLTCLTPDRVMLTAGEESLHRDSKTEKVMPAYRAAFTHAPGKTHRLITLIEAIPPTGRGTRARVNVLDAPRALVEVRHGGLVARVAASGRTTPADALWGCTSDGELMFAVREKGKLATAGTFAASRFETPEGRVTGKGFLSFPHRLAPC